LINKAGQLLTAGSKDQLAMAKFSKSKVCDKVPEQSTLIFGDYQISLYHSIGKVKGSPHAKTSFISLAILTEL